MLLAVALVTAFLAGVLVGRVWEIRLRIILAEPIDERSRPVEIRAATKVAQGQDNEGLAALERETQDLIRGMAVKARRAPGGGTAPAGSSVWRTHSGSAGQSGSRPTP